MDVIGERFGEGFQVLREIAKGALARVYLTSDGRLVKALKLFPRIQGERAVREFGYGGGLDHPNVNPVEALVEVGGYPGVLMPYLPGTSLGGWLMQGHGRARFLEVFRQLLAAIGYLHDLGILHRDIKPENVIVSGDGRARLVDFDLAVRSNERQRLRTLVGTVAYLSPEQAEGRPATAASDLYAAGVILYRGLTGEVPFSGSVEEVIHAHQRGEPAPLSAFDAGLAAFEPLLARLLAKRAEARFASAAAVLEALTAAVAPRGCG